MLRKSQLKASKKGSTKKKVKSKDDSKALQEKINELRDTVRKLESDSEQHEMAETESQQSFEFLNQQIGAVRSAFSTLSEVIVEEIDDMRGEYNRKLSEMEQRINDVDRFQKELSFKETMDIITHSFDVADSNIRSLASDLRTLTDKYDANEIETAKRLKKTEDKHDILHKSVSAVLEVDFPAEILRISETTNAIDAKVQSMFHEFQKDYASAISATAADLSAIMKQHEQLRQDVTQETLKLGNAIRKCNVITIDASSNLSKRIEEFNDNYQSQQDTVQKEFESLASDVSRDRIAAQNNERILTTEIRKVNAALKNLDARVVGSRTALVKTVETLEDDNNRRFDEVSHAIGVFADLMGSQVEERGFGTTVSPSSQIRGLGISTTLNQLGRTQRRMSIESKNPTISDDTKPND